MLDEFISDEDGTYWFKCSDHSGHNCLCGIHMNQGDKLWCIDRIVVYDKDEDGVQFFCSKLCITYYCLGNI